MAPFHSTVFKTFTWDYRPARSVDGTGCFVAGYEGFEPKWRVHAADAREESMRLAAKTAHEEWWPCD